MARAIEGRVPAVISSNFSIGVNIFWQLVREAARLIPDYDIEVIEAHHRYKKDAPSGTAKTIIQVLEEEVGERQKLYGREGMMERGKEIGVHVIRGGTLSVTIRFFLPGISRPYRSLTGRMTGLFSPRGP